MLTFFNNTAEDLAHTIQNLHDVSLTEEKCLMKGAFSMKVKLLLLTDMEQLDCLGPLQPFAGHSLENIYISVLFKWCHSASPHLHV
jgi:hypothetical protein